MKGAAEALVFGGLALGLHLAVFAAAPGGAPGGSGAAGDSTVTVQAADGALRALVARWDTPPAAATALPDAPPAPPQAAAAAPQAAHAPSAPPAPVSAPAAPPPRTAAPEPSTAPAAPRTTRAPERTPRPPARPAEPEAKQRKADAQTPRAAPAPAQRAAGTGGGAAAGRGGAADAPSVDPARRERLMAQWGGGIRAAVQRRLRPAGSVTGTTRVRLSVTDAGHLAGARIVASSGHAGLDRAALAAVRGARFPHAPSGIASGAYAFTLPLTQR